MSRLEAGTTILRPEHMARLRDVRATLPCGAVWVYLELAAITNLSGMNRWRQLETLAETLGMPARTVRHYALELERAGLVEREAGLVAALRTPQERQESAVSKGRSHVNSRQGLATKRQESAATPSREPVRNANNSPLKEEVSEVRTTTPPTPPFVAPLPGVPAEVVGTDQNPNGLTLVSLLTGLERLPDGDGIGVARETSVPPAGRDAPGGSGPSGDERSPDELDGRERHRYNLLRSWPDLRQPATAVMASGIDVWRAVARLGRKAGADDATLGQWVIGLASDLREHGREPVLMALEVANATALKAPGSAFAFYRRCLETELAESRKVAPALPVATVVDSPGEYLTGKDRRVVVTEVYDGLAALDNGDFVKLEFTRAWRAA